MRSSGLDLLRWNGTTGADWIHTLLDSLAHVSFPDFIALSQKAETFTNDFAGGFVVPNRHFLADKFLHRFWQRNVHVPTFPSISLECQILTLRVTGVMEPRIALRCPVL